MARISILFLSLLSASSVTAQESRESAGGTDALAQPSNRPSGFPSDLPTTLSTVVASARFRQGRTSGFSRSFDSFLSSKDSDNGASSVLTVPSAIASPLSDDFELDGASTTGLNPVVRKVSSTDDSDSATGKTASATKTTKSSTKTSTKKSSTKTASASKTVSENAKATSTAAASKAATSDENTSKTATSKTTGKTTSKTASKTATSEEDTTATGKASSKTATSKTTTGKSTGKTSTKAATTSVATTAAAGNNTGSSGSGSTNTELRTTFPTASSTTGLSAVKTISAGESFDGSMVQYDRSPSTCKSQTEGGDSDAVFILQEGATLSNVIIGPDNGEGIHCKGACTLNNVWWVDVCEDAATFKQTSGTSYVNGGGAQSASDKVLQHNGGGTVAVKNFYASNVGKLYRSCGNCATQYARTSTFTNVRVSKATVLGGINTNLNDTITISNSCVLNSAICYEYTGNSNGKEPTKVGSAPDGTNCIANNVQTSGC